MPLDLRLRKADVRAKMRSMNSEVGEVGLEQVGNGAPIMATEAHNGPWGLFLLMKSPLYVGLLCRFHRHCQDFFAP